MSKLSRAERARVNGAKSKGPVTPEGKAASSQNAFQHGFCGSRVRIMQWESTEEFDYLRASYLQRFTPADQVELDRIEQMVDSVWRRRRLITIETTILDIEIAVGAEAVDAKFRNADGAVRIAVAFHAKHGDNSFAMLHRYITATERSFTRALHELRLLQGARFAQDRVPPPFEEDNVEDDIDSITGQTQNNVPKKPAGTHKLPAANIPEKITA